MLVVLGLCTASVSTEVLLQAGHWLSRSAMWEGFLGLCSQEFLDGCSILGVWFQPTFSRLVIHSCCEDLGEALGWSFRFRGHVVLGQSSFWRIRWKRVSGGSGWEGFGIK